MKTYTQTFATRDALRAYIKANKNTPKRVTITSNERERSNGDQWAASITIKPRKQVFNVVKRGDQQIAVVVN